MKTYKGDRTIDGILVTVDDQLLDQRLDLKTITDDGFEWSFEGPASAQLALAIVAVLGPGLLNAMLAITIVNIPFFARAVRGATVSLVQREFIDAAR